VNQTGIRIFSVHYLWEDCVSMVLGALIALTSWMVGDAGSQTVAANAVIIGILVLALGRLSSWICVAGKKGCKPRAVCG
jgi:hypothetical protein